MRVYFDNNIIVSIEDNEIDFSVLKKTWPNVSYVYSSIHIQELLEAKSNIDELKIKRLKTILNLTDNTYIYSDCNQINTIIQNPERVILTIKMYSELFDLTRKVVCNFNIDRTELIKGLNIDIKRINNYKPKEVIEYLSNATNEKLLLGIANFIDLAGTSLQERIGTLFNFLDFVGFWKDVKTQKSNLARFYDSSHTFFATSCDIFVSNDKRARNKAKVAYLLYNVNTLVLSYNEFLEHKK